MNQNNHNGYFVGEYVPDVVDALVASALGKVHLLLISGPGTGKTKISQRAAYDMFGRERTVLIRLAATTPPEKITGLPDAGKMLNPPYEIVEVTTGTPYDPKAKVVIPDEMYRAMDPVFDIFLDSMDRLDIDPADAPVHWATSNFMPSSERTEALRDRIGIVVFVQPDEVNVQELVKAQMAGMGGLLHLPPGLNVPTWEEIDQAWHAKPGPNATDAVAELLELLDSEAKQGITRTKKVKGGEETDVNFTFDPSRRRFDQWKDILFRVGFYLTGDADFKTVPDQAIRALRFAWPTSSMEEAEAWKEIVSAVSNPIETAINELKRATYDVYKEIMGQELSKSNLAVQLGRVMSDSISKMRESARIAGKDPDDPVIKQAISEIQNTQAKIVRGENPFK